MVDNRPWSEPVRLSEVQRGARVLTLAADEAARRRIADMLEIDDLQALTAEVELAPWLDGVELRAGDILLAAGGSATRRLASPDSSYVVVSVPDGSSVMGGVDLVEPDGDVAGLASVPLVSPDTSGPPPVVQQDPGAGR